jgi:argininosuccinate lyase
VAAAAKGGVTLDEMPLKALQAIEPKITSEALAALSVEASVKSRTSYGGTAPRNVRAQAKAWLKRLEKERKTGRTG